MEAGTIVRHHWLTAGKLKYFVFLGYAPATHEVGCFVINTRPRYGHNQREWQLLLPFKHHNSVLKHDSYVDCSQIIRLDCDEFMASFERVGQTPTKVADVDWKKLKLLV